MTHLTNEEIQEYIEKNCRNEGGEPMMDEQAFYEGAKWYRETLIKNDSISNKKQGMKKVQLLGRIEDFEEFINRTDIEVIQVDIKVVESSIVFQQGFAAVVFYKLLS